MKSAHPHALVRPLPGTHGHRSGPGPGRQASPRTLPPAAGPDVHPAPRHGAGAHAPPPGHHQAHAWTMPPARPGDHLVLMPGQLYFGTKAASARTLLGSCVAITLWHPQRRMGGMCHYLLPSRKTPGHTEREGRFGEEALAMMVEWLRAAGTQPAEYEAQLYGGADTQPGSPDAKTGIGERNIERGWQLIDHYGFNLQAVDVGENVPRNVHMNLVTGVVDMRRGAPIVRKA